MVSPSPGRARILIIDDEDAVRSMLTRALALWQYDTVAVRSGEEAIRLLEAGEHFACILLDLTMPGIGGEAALREVDRLAPGTPVAVMSGYPRDDLTREGRHFLSKPFDLQELQALITKLTQT